MKIRRGRLIPRDDGKRIEELVGAVHTRTDSVSVARMLAPPGWVEPAQTPEFDEVVVVERGVLTLVLGRRRERIGPGEVGLVPHGARVIYRNDGAQACRYLSICAPAFRPERAHFSSTPPRRRTNRVALDARHPAAARARGLAPLARRFLGALGLEGCELSLSLVTDAEIRRLNRRWRKKDEATDVLSFPADAPPPGTPGPRPLGDVVISLDTTARAAREEGRSFSDELARYLAHGLLHLLGHDHQKPAQARKMAAAEARLLGRAGMVPRT